MTHPTPPTPPVDAFFLAAARGQRFCLYHAPAGPCRGTVLYAPPFGEEMNKARRMASLQARALARQGYGVLLMDLFGCGDSAGDSGEARWDLWLDDLALGARWLRELHAAPPALWGLRLGALLALDFARHAPAPPRRLLLWQPPTSGAALLTQFLRLKMASQMLAADGPAEASSAALRSQLRDGATLEIGGYRLSPALAGAIDALDAAALAPVGCVVDWIDVAARAEAGPTPAARKVVDAWRGRDVNVRPRVVAGPPFWATQDITDNAALLDASCAALA